MTMVSPKFHFQHDEFFEIAHPSARNLPKLLSGFKLSMPHHLYPSDGGSGTTNKAEVSKLVIPM